MESERTVSQFRNKEKGIFCVVLTHSVKRAREIRKFHVVVVQRWLKKFAKKRDASAKLLFY